MTRRTALQLLTGMAAGLAHGRSFANTQNAEPDPQTPGLGSKFDADGRALPFAGNTVICLLDHKSGLYGDLSRVHDEWKKHEFIRRIALVPPSSYHMTVFSGANDQDRRPGRWPAGIGLSVPISECDQIVEQRLKQARFPLSLPLRFRIDDDPAHQVSNGSGIRLIPFDETEMRKIRHLRDELADVIQIHIPDHDTYQFHITLGYWVQRFTQSEKDDYNVTLARTVAGLRAKIESVDFQAPVYCVFDDMMAYRSQTTLNV
jgi:hypothetical protein